MLRILLVLLLMASSSEAWATQWRAGTGENSLLGTSNAADIDYNSYNSIVKPLDNLLATYCNLYLTYTSATTITVSVGSVVVSNSQGSIRLFLQNTTTSTITSANIDTGALASGTTYYVYATAASNSATAPTFYFSASNSAPSGQTYYYQIGSFTTDSSSQFTNIVSLWSNYNIKTPTSKTIGVTYQALTDGTVEGKGGQIAGGEGDLDCYTDSSSTPTFSPIGYLIQNDVGTIRPYTMRVRRGDYYKCVASAHWTNSSLYFIPEGQ